MARWSAGGTRTHLASKLATPLLAPPTPLPTLLPAPPWLISLPPYRFQELERAQEAHRAELASVAEAGAELAQYRATLDLASQQMAMVLELLRGDVEGLK